MGTKAGIAERIRHMRLMKSLTQGDLAKKVGVTLASVSQWELGTNTPRPPKVAKLAEVFGVEVEWMYTGAESQEVRESGPGYNAGSTPRSAFSSSDLQPGQLVNIVSLDEHIRIMPSVADWNGDVPANVSASDSKPILSDWLIRGELNPAYLAAFEVPDKAMSPSIDKGDVIFVDRSKCKIEHGRIYLLRKDSSLFIRRINQLVKGIELEADNSQDYSSETFSKEEFSRVDVVGRVVLRTGAL